MAHLRIWKFRPAAGREEQFETAYGSAGLWARLFARSSGYIGTTLLRPVESGGWWLTIDRWESASAFETFSKDFGEPYRALDLELEGTAGEEEFVGAFEEAD